MISKERTFLRILKMHCILYASKFKLTFQKIHEKIMLYNTFLLFHIIGNQQDQKLYQPISNEANFRLNRKWLLKSLARAKDWSIYIVVPSRLMQTFLIMKWTSWLPHALIDWHTFLHSTPLSVLVMVSLSVLLCSSFHESLC